MDNFDLLEALTDEAYRIGGVEGKVYICTQCNLIFAHSKHLSSSKELTCTNCLNSHIIELGHTVHEVIKALESTLNTRLSNITLEPDEDTIVYSL